MSYSNISAVLSDADMQSIREVITTLNNKLPFLVTLSVDERRTIFKMGSKSVDFVQGSLEAVNSYPSDEPIFYS